MPANWTDALGLTVLRATLRPERPWRHDEPALALRGALGAAVLHLACVHDPVACRACPVRPCPAADWYDRGLRGGGAHRPFWLRARSGPDGRVDERSPLRLTWTFEGELPRASLVLEAVHRAARVGLGAERIPHGVDLEWWDGDGWRSAESSTPAAVPLTTLARPLPAEGPVVIRTVTRLRLKREGRVLRRPTVADLVEALVLRIRAMERRLGVSPAPAWPAPEPFGAPVRCAWATGGRWSRRQGEEVDLSGADAAWAVDAAEVAPWADLLAVARTLQLGAATTAGLGVLEVSAVAGDFAAGAPRRGVSRSSRSA